jgi:TonB family protein
VNARSATIIGSIVLHGVLALAAVLYDSGQKRHRSTTVMVVGAEKKKETPKKEEPPKPLPKRVAMRSRESIPTPPTTPVPVKPEPSHPARSTAPPQVGGDYSNTPAGPDDPNGVWDGKGERGRPGSGAPVGPTKVVTPRRTAEEDPCQETPTKPQPLSRQTEIEYTQQARADGVEGRLVLKIIVGKDGAVMDVVVVSGVEPSLDAAAIAAVKTWVFKPAQRCGKQMGGGVFMYAHRFELGD